MADPNQTQDDPETTSSTEPATKHDIGIGGGLGAVGGAIVGALAGGPIGAIIGAVAGGAASAGAVDVVDKHDHDYARTAPQSAAINTDEAPDYPVSDSSARSTATEYTGPGDFQRTQTPNQSFAAVAEAPVSSQNTQAADSRNEGPIIGTNSDRTVQLHEEQLHASTQAVQAGEVSLRKEVITETKSIDVPVTREEVVIERHAVSGGAPAGSFDTQADQVVRVPVMEEQVTVQKTPVVTEEISLGKREVTETRHITDTVRREEAVIENPDNVDVLERGSRP